MTRYSLDTVKYIDYNEINENDMMIFRKRREKQNEKIDKNYVPAAGYTYGIVGSSRRAV